MNYLHQIGYYGPRTLILLILMLIIITTSNPYNIPYNIYYVIVWQLCNHFINIIIKNTLKHPRPDNFNKDFNLLTPTIYNYFSIHKNFGMPSGHAQQVFSELTFISLYFKNPVITIISILQSCITLWQRYSERKHSIKQLMVGSLIGVISGVIFYKYFSKIVK